MITLKESMASITISGTETVQFENGYYKYAAISNTGGSDIYVSAKNSECTVPNDGVICIQPGASTVIRIFDAAFFISGEGTIQLIGQYDNRNPFKSAPTADGGVQASGTPIQMDGLQGGVPFSEMVVSGKNLIAQPNWVEQSGGTVESNGITYTLNPDKSITANGTATDISYCALSHLTLSPNVNLLIKNTDYFFSGVPEGGGENTYNMYLNIYDENGTRVNIFVDHGSGVNVLTNKNYRCCAMITIKKGQTVNNLIFRPQLELGTTATAYEPPIAGRNLTVNVNGTEYTITPDSNPYVVPNDIRQVEGLNNISISEGEISVTGVRKNAAIKRIWDEIDEIKTAIIVSNGESE